MAKRNDIDHEPDDDFSGDPEHTTPTSGIRGFLSRLPFAGLIDSIGDFFANVSMSVRGIFNDKDKPFLPIALLGGVVVLLLVLAIVLFVALGGALSGSNATAKSTLSVTTNQSVTNDTVEGQMERSQGNDLGIRDPFLTKPIVPDEPLFMAKGEIHYHRVPEENWGLSDIVPGWQDLGHVYRTMLRERNSANFYHMMGEEAPPPNRY